MNIGFSLLKYETDTSVIKYHDEDSKPFFVLDFPCYI